MDMIQDAGQQDQAEQNLRECYEDWINDPQAQREYREWELRVKHAAWIAEYDAVLALNENANSNAKEQDMGRLASDTGGSDFKQAPAGSHVARCIGIVDIGTHHGEYQGVPNIRNQFIVRWELPLETDTFDGKELPFIVSKFYTNSLSEKANLRRDLESWRSRAFTEDELRGFDLENIVGKPCILSIAHNDKGKARVVGVSALTKGTTCPPQVNPTNVFWIEEWDQAKFDALPEGFQKLIMESDEYKERMQPKKGRSIGSQSNIEHAEERSLDPDSDIPF